MRVLRLEVREVVGDGREGGGRGPSALVQARGQQEGADVDLRSQHVVARYLRLVLEPRMSKDLAQLVLLHLPKKDFRPRPTTAPSFSHSDGSGR